METERRRASLIILDAGNRLLLFRYARATGDSYWTIPGGGLEPGETFEMAAVREAREELGLEHPTFAALGGQTAEFPLAGVRVRQETRFFLARVSHMEFDQAVLDVHRCEGVAEVRWWSLGEIASSGESIFPEDLATILRGVVAAGKIEQRAGGDGPGAIGGPTRFLLLRRADALLSDGAITPARWLWLPRKRAGATAPTRRYGTSRRFIRTNDHHASATATTHT